MRSVLISRENLRRPYHISIIYLFFRYGALLNYLCNKRDSVALSHQMNWGAQVITYWAQFGLIRLNWALISQ